MTDKQEKDSKSAEESVFEAFIEHQRKAFDEAGKAIDSLMPPDFKTHGKNAVLEAIEGFRVVANAFADEMKTAVDRATGGDKDAPAEPKSTGKNKVKVDVE